jgi:hypothetical protein
MELCSHNECATYFGFDDLHGFKDFVTEVITGAPGDFMQMDWLKPEEQMNLERAFVGLRYGLQITASEKGESALLDTSRQLVEAAYRDYRSGDEVAGQAKLEQMEKLIRKLPSQ